jgi:undecaprenyl-diphosphatase
LRNQLRNQRTTLLVSLLFLVSFLLVALLKSSFAAIDANVNSWATSIQTNFLTAIAEIISYVFDTTSLLAISLLSAAFLFYKNYRKYSVLLLAAMGGDAAIVSIVKTLVHSARPLNGLMYDAGFSFPSGHAVGSIIFCGLLTYFGWQLWRSPKARAALGTLFVALTSFVGFDRVYLNVHWFSDVLGGYLLGLFLLTFSILASQRLGTSKKFPIKDIRSTTIFSFSNDFDWPHVNLQNTPIHGVISWTESFDNLVQTLLGHCTQSESHGEC